MSPLKKKKLDLVRIKLDKLDNSLINIIKKRTLLVKKVLELKEFKNEILALDSSIRLIGQIEEGAEVKVLNENDEEIEYTKDGWEPFTSI